MIMYMSDMTARPSLGYNAGDCIFTGSRTKERPKSRGSRLLQAGRREKLCGGGFLIACTVFCSESPYSSSTVRCTGTAKKVMQGSCQGFLVPAKSTSPRSPPSSNKFNIIAAIAGIAIHHVRNPSRLRCQCISTQKSHQRCRKSSQRTRFPPSSSCES